MIKYCIARLLRVANSSPPTGARDEFYAIKDRILSRWGKRIRDDFQHIEKRCWGPRDYNGDSEGCPGKGCYRCGGTGIWENVFVRLAAYEIAGLRFHRPLERSYSRPFGMTTISGRIEHRHRGRSAREAALWLFLLFGELRTFGTLMWRSGYCDPGLWPLCSVNYHVRQIRSAHEWLFGRRTCVHCYRDFYPRGSGWQVCKPCRFRPEAAGDDMPF